MGSVSRRSARDALALKALERYKGALLCPDCHHAWQYRAPAVRCCSGHIVWTEVCDMVAGFGHVLDVGIVSHSMESWESCKLLRVDGFVVVTHETCSEQMVRFFPKGDNHEQTNIQR